MIVATKRRMPTRGPAGSFRVNVRNAGMGSYRNSDYWTWLQDMKNYFEQLITGPSFTMDLDVYFEDLGEKTLGQCGPGTGAWDNFTSIITGDFLTLSGSTAIVKQATMRMSTRYFKITPTNATERQWRQQFFHIAIHEFFHAVGFGSLWNGEFRITTAINWIGSGNWTVTRLPSLFPYNVVGVGNPYPNPRYTASYGLAAYREQMVGQSGAAYIPIENYGMSTYTTMANAGGTALAHWRQESNHSGGQYPGLSDIYDRKRRDGYYEIMTGWSHSGMDGEYDNEEWVSRFTAQSLRDIGYSVSNTPTDIPLHYFKSVH